VGGTPVNYVLNTQNGQFTQLNPYGYYGASLSSDGHYAAYQKNGNVYRMDLTDPNHPETFVANGDGPRISPNGRYVVFYSYGSLVPEDTNGAADFYVTDLQNNTTTRVSVSATGVQNSGGIGFADVANDGSVTFGHSASNLVAGDTNNASDVFATNMLIPGGTGAAGSVAEVVGTPTAGALLSTTAGISFSDTDVADTHQLLSPTGAFNAGASSNAATALGTLTASIGHDTTNGIGGLVTWTYTVDAAAVEYLGAGQTRVEAFDVQVIDNNGGTATKTILITINGSNDAPVNTIPGAQSVNEDTALSFGSTVSVHDVDGNLASAQLTVLHGTMHLGSLGGASVSAGANDSATLTLAGTETQINAALATLSYQGVLNYNGGDTLTVLSKDSAGTPLTDSDTVAITVNPVNDAPVNTVPGAQTVNQDTALSFGSTVSVHDVDGNLASTQLTVLHGTLHLGSLGGASVSAGANDSATLTLSGSETQIDTALATLSYQGALHYTGADTLTVLSKDSASTPLTDTDTVGITVQAVVNQAPVAHDDLLTSTNVAPSGTGWSQFGGHYYKMVVSSDTWTQANTDAQTTGGYLATITSSAEDVFVRGLITQNYAWAGGSDAAAEGSWRWVTGPEAGTLFWTGLSAAQGGVAAPGAYTHWNSDEPNNSGGSENYLALTPGGWNDGPNGGPGGSLSYIIEWGGLPGQGGYTEDAVVTTTAAVLLANDTDADGDTLSITSVAATSANGAAVSYNSGTGQITYDSTNASAIQALAAGQTLTDSFTYAITDGHSHSSTATVSLVINGMNDAPTLAHAIADQSGTTGTAFTLQFAANTFNDVDSGDTLTYSAKLADGSALPSWLQFNATTRTFSGTPGAADNTISVMVTATDHSNATASDTFAITLPFHNHAPVLMSIGDGVITKTSTQIIASQTSAIVLDGHFALSANSDIGNATTIPHVSITAAGSGGVDYYKFTASAGSSAIFDIDHTSDSLDTYINLIDANGNSLSTGDDSNTSSGAGGSTSGLDSYLQYTFTTTGTYYIEVGTYSSISPPASMPLGASYALQVSLTGELAPLALNDYTAGSLGAPSGAVGTKISSLVGLQGNGGHDNVTDSDAGAVTGIALSGTDTSHGTWYYSLNNGGTWIPVGTVDNTHALLLAADANTRLYFQPNSGFSGSVSNAITFHAWDTTSGNVATKVDASINGGATAISTVTETASIGVLGSPTVTVTAPTHSGGSGSFTFTFSEAVIGFDQTDISLGSKITGHGTLVHVGLDSSGRDVYTETFTYSSSGSTGRSATVTGSYTDLAGNVGATGAGISFPAGVSGEPINLALTDASADHVGAISLTVGGVPAGWTLSEGLQNSDGTWSVHTNDVASLSITSPEGYTGALVLQVTESWTDSGGVAHNVYVSDNVEAYAKGAPIFAWSGDDTLTASGGNDTLVFANKIGTDVVHNFDTAHDKIDLVGFDGIASFADVQAHLGTDAAGNAVITLGDGQTITLNGVSAASLTADDFVFNEAAVTHNTGSMVLSDGALLPMSGDVENSGIIHLESTGNETAFEIVQLGLKLLGGGEVTLSDNSENVVFGSDPSVTLTNVDNTISGAGQLGDGQMTLVNEGTIVATGSNALVIDTGGNTIVNTGTLEATGSGGLVVHSSVANDGTLWANGGAVTLEGDVNGSGSARISGNGSLEIGGAFNERIMFDDSASGTLKLDHPDAFSGVLTGFGGHDVLDLSGILGASASLSYVENAQGSGGVLSVTDGAHSAKIAFSGQFSTADFHITADDHGSVNHTLIQMEHQVQQLTAAA
jgi:VCBS repeat-containing protein